MLPVDTSSAPAAVGPYSQAIRAGNFLFVSGQLPIDPATGAFAPGGAVEQARQSLKNIAAIAAAAGTDMTRCVKTTVLLTDLGAFAAVNEEYATFFSAPYPARACYQVAALPKGALVEIEAVFEV
ncbi:RidA family protein [Breoghania sp. JC706]|uniref:RidA family protein n=1 Tax=Breoghania sp. JC706 TaxID=3117732 RepID=UPI00300B4068